MVRRGVKSIKAVEKNKKCLISSIIRYSGRAIERFGEKIEKFAIAEGLTGHAKSITIRRHKA